MTATAKQPCHVLGRWGSSPFPEEAKRALRTSWKEGARFVSRADCAQCLPRGAGVEKGERAGQTRPERTARATPASAVRAEHLCLRGGFAMYAVTEHRTSKTSERTGDCLIPDQLLVGFVIPQSLLLRKQN